MCARVGGQTHIDFEPRHSLKTIEWRVPFVFESRPSFFLKRSRPSPLPPIPFFKSPPARNQNGEERQGERAPRAVLRAWRGSEGRHAIGAYLGGFKPPRTRSVRSGFAQSVELDHHFQNFHSRSWRTRRARSAGSASKASTMRSMRTDCEPFIKMTSPDSMRDGSSRTAA